MRSLASAVQHKPRLCVIASGQLGELVMSVVPEFEARASIEVVGSTFGTTLEVAKRRLKEARIDAFVTAGYAANVVRTGLGVPVGTIQVTGFDLLEALLEARRSSNRIGLMMYGSVLPRLDAVRELLNIDLRQVTYATPDEVSKCFDELQRAGCEVVVGSNAAVEAAQKAGLKGLLAYSRASIRDAFEAGVELARVARLEACRYEQLNGVLRNLQEAVLAVDREHRIIAINPPMCGLLAAGSESVLGELLDRIVPDLSLRDVLLQGAEERGKLQRFAQRDWLVNRTPIREAGEVVGATVTLHDPHHIQQADAWLRMQQRRHQAAARHSFESLVGRSELFQRAVSTARRFALTDLTVLIEGESGVGKELFAQAIHNASRRGARPFVALNCASFAESLLESELFGYEEGAFTGSRRGGKAGLVEAAHTGTLFLDEIGDMPLSLQTRLLRVLQERQITRLGATTPVPVDVRVIAATHQPLRELIAEKRFRHDLYFRLNTLRLPLPALRDRPGDVEVLAAFQFARALRRLGLDWDAESTLAPLVKRLAAYRWPGNVRELENVCERIAVYLMQFPHADEVNFDGLYVEVPELFETGEVSFAERTATRERVLQALSQSEGNRQRAARSLGVSRSTLWRWCRDMGLESTDEPPAGEHAGQVAA